MKGKVLIIEDQLLVARYYEKILKEDDFQTEVVKNSNEFFLFYYEYNPDVVIVDIHLNDSHLSGIEIIEKVKEDKQIDSEFIIISSEVKKDILDRVKKIGVFTIIEKNGKFDQHRFRYDMKNAWRSIIQQRTINQLMKENIMLKAE